MTVNQAIELLIEQRNRGLGESQLFYLAKAHPTNEFNGSEWTGADIVESKPKENTRAVVIW